VPDIVRPNNLVESSYYRLTVPDAAARETVLADFRTDPEAAPFVAQEQLRLNDYGSAPQPLFSRLPIPYRVVPQRARTALLSFLYGRAARRLGDTVEPRWPVERGLDDERRRRWASHAGWRGVPVGGPRWPEGRAAAFLLTHDIDTAADLDRIAPLREVERALRVPASIGFVPEASWPTQAFAESLVAEGCELYLHDLRHDGKLPYLAPAAMRAAIDRVFALSSWARPLMRGFRAGQLLTSHALREVVGELFEYDLSIPDTERGGPYGYAAGCATVFPFRVGSLMEIPLTLPQDVYLRHVYRLSADEALTVWRTKLAHIMGVGGVAVLNVHPIWVNPDRPDLWGAFRTFMAEVAANERLWVTTPSPLLDWLRQDSANPDLTGATVAAAEAAKA
jgi:hypothetical protein